MSFVLVARLRVVHLDFRRFAEGKNALWVKELKGRTLAENALRESGTELPIEVTLCVQDDGAGFDPALAQTDGMGLRIMEYRARSLGGSMTVRSEPQQGTEITCSIPTPAQEP